MTNGVKGAELKPPVVTVIGCELVPVGTVTVREPAEAAVTGTLTDPNQTILAAGAALKLLPVMVTVVLTAPEAGAMEFMTGCANTGRGNRRAMK